MTQKALSAVNAWQWIVCGWQNFLKNPFICALSTMVCIIVMFVLTKIPFVGSVLAYLAIPTLTAFVLMVVLEIEKNRDVGPKQLLLIFQNLPNPIQLALLGLVPLAISLLQKEVLASSAPQILAALIGSLLTITAVSVLLFAMPLVVMDNKPTLQAVATGLRRCLGQPVAVGSFLGLAVLLVIPVLLTLGLGLLVYFPVMVGAMLAGYRQVTQGGIAQPIPSI